MNIAIIPAGTAANGAIGICPVATNKILGKIAAITIAVADFVFARSI